MTFRERTLAIMAHRQVDGIVYQPRLEFWYHWNRQKGTLPTRYRDMSLLDVFDDLNCSIRSYGWYNPCLKVVDDASVKFDARVVGDIHIHRWDTPVGSIDYHIRVTPTASHSDKYPVETPEDVRVMEYILRGRSYEFDMDLFARNDAIIGDRAAPMMYIARVNLQRLFLDLMGVENTLYALADDPGIVEHLIGVVNETDDRMLQVVAESPVPIVNYGDNVDQHFLSPKLFERYVLPEYQRRSDYLRSAGKFTYAHWDGSCRALLPYARMTHMDGIEAITPLPQGDVTLRETKDALGDMVLLDGIPMTWFLPHERVEDLVQVTRETIEMFSPNLILGISDEPSPVCDIERVRMVADMVNGIDPRSPGAGGV